MFCCTVRFCDFGLLSYADAFVFWCAFSGVCVVGGFSSAVVVRLRKLFAARCICFIVCFAWWRSGGCWVSYWFLKCLVLCLNVGLFVVFGICCVAGGFCW